MTGPVIRLPSVGEEISQGLAPLLNALMQRQQMQAEQQRMAMSAEDQELRRQQLELQARNLEARIKAEEADQRLNALLGLQVAGMLGIKPTTGTAATAPTTAPTRPTATPAAKPAAKPTGQPATPSTAPLTLDAAIQQIVDVDPSAVPEAFKILAPIAEARDKQMQAVEADRIFATALDTVGDPALRRLLRLDRAFQLAGTTTEVRTMAMRDALTQARIDTPRIDKLRQDPRFATLAVLPDDQFLPAVARVLEKQTELALGIGGDALPKTKEEFILQHMPRLAFPGTDFFGQPTPASMTPEVARDFLGGIYDAATKQRRAFGVQANKPLPIPNHEAMAQVGAQMVGQPGVTVEAVRALIKEALPDADERAITAILLRIGALRQPLTTSR